MLPRSDGMRPAPGTAGTAGTADAAVAGHEVTAALGAVRAGAPDAMERLYALVYADLQRIAHRRLAAEAVGHTLGTTGLVHEAYLRLVPVDIAWADRRHFFAVAARAMRRILVDHARRHRALRRGGGREALTTTAAEWSRDARLATERADELLALDDALARLATVDARLAAVVELRFFAGLTEEEAAQALGITARTVRRDWTKARTWLYREVRHDLA